MTKLELLCGCAMALVATPAMAQTAATTSSQDTAPTAGPGQEATTAEAAPEATYGEDIVVTAQRQSQRLQDVPIAVSAFTAENIEKQQIVNPLALQQSLPSVTFTKTNFTSSSFTIRGIGDLCVGVTCDSATAIHVNDMPLLGSRLFESEFFDLERVEVLRGPQGTLFGRNATSGVVNFITAKPDLSGIHAAGEAEYGNYDSKRVRGMINLPLTDTLGVRAAGVYLNRDGFTYNQFTKNKVDGRDLYALRGTVSWEPSADTRVDLIGYYFRENDSRARIQKQLCSRDATGVLGCRPDQLGYGVTNANSQLTTIFSSTEVINSAIRQSFPAAAVPLLTPLYTPLTTGSLYQSPDAYGNATNPADPRVINADFDPTYFASEQQYQLKLFHDFGSVSLNVTGGYSKNTVRSREDFNLAVSSFPASTLATLNAYATPGVLTGAVAGLQPGFKAYRDRLIPNGPTGGLCVSAPDPNNVGVFGGNTFGCFATPQDFDESSQKVEQYSAEAHLDSKFDGMFNFLVGGIYFDQKTKNNSYYVNAFALDYTAALLGSLTSTGALLGGNPTPPALFRASPFYRNNTDFFELKSYGLFGETYFDFGDKLKLTLGLRYNHDDKTVAARSALFVDAVGTAILVPVGGTSFASATNLAALDFDSATAGLQDFARGSVTFQRLTGRAVVDYRVTPNNLLYASYSRGYKSGGFNPPLSPSFSVSQIFTPETIDAFEIGSKNTFGHGQLRLNLTGFYYKYKGLQLSRIVSRTAVNDNVNADIYGVEAEAVMSPTPGFVVNANFSYLRTKVASDKFLADTRDPSGGRADAVIIKDISNAANCAVIPTTAGNVAGVNGFVGAINTLGLGLRAPVAGLRAPTPTGAFSSCATIAADRQPAPCPPPPRSTRSSRASDGQFGVATGAFPFTVLGSGVEVNIRGNQLPGAPTYKASVGAQYTIPLGSRLARPPRRP